MVDLAARAGELVGVPGLSGLPTEARKRLTIGVELVPRPAALFLDEPTSGARSRCMRCCHVRCAVLHACMAGWLASQVRSVLHAWLLCCVHIACASPAQHPAVPTQRRAHAHARARAGLDARAASIVMAAVKAAGAARHTVVVTIHQPSIQIFEAFDSLLLLQARTRTHKHLGCAQHSHCCLPGLANWPAHPHAVPPAYLHAC